MSMWLSGANSVMNRARGQATAAGRREASAIATRGMGDVLDFWSKAAGAAVGKRVSQSRKAPAAATKRATAAKSSRRSRSR